MTADKNILLIAYYFPPLGMGGAGRPYALFTKLPEFGYNVHVLTVKNILYPHYDYSLLNENDETRITRTNSLDPSRILYQLGKRKQPSSSFSKTGATFFYRPDLKRFWSRFALKAAEKLFRQHTFKAIITTSPPPSTHMVGRELKRKLNLPWIADFRDLWFLQSIEDIYKNQSARRFAVNLKEKIVTEADHTVGVNDIIGEYLNSAKYTTIMNGSDLDFFDVWKNKTANKEKFTIGVLGTVNNQSTIDLLLTAVDSIIVKYPEKSDHLQILHAGHIDNGYMKVKIKNSPASKLFKSLGYLPKKQAIKALSVCDALYFDVPTLPSYSYLPGRLFDLLLSGKPIIGIAPDKCDAADLIRNYKFGHLITKRRSELVENLIMDLYTLKQKGSKENPIDRSEVEKYSTLRLAREYAELLDSLL